MPVTGPLNLEKASWLAVGVGLHLLSLASARMVAGASLTAMTPYPGTEPTATATESVRRTDRFARIFSA